MMAGKDKTREQLIKELVKTRQRVAELKASEIKLKRANEQNLARLHYLQNSEKKYRLIADNTLELVWLMDLDLKFTYANPSIFTIFGYTEEEFIGAHLSEHCSPETMKIIMSKVQQALNDLEHNSGVVFEAALYHKKGNEIPVEITGKILLNEQGNPIGLQGSVRDITKRKQAEEDIRQRAFQLETLRKMSLELTAQMDLDTLLHSVASRAIELLKGTAGGLYLYRADLDALEWIVVTSSHLAPVGAILHRGEGMAGKVWETGKPLIVDDYQHWEGRAEIYKNYHFTSVIQAPIFWGEEFLGVVNINGDPSRAFSSDDAELLELFAAQAATAIRNARLYEQAQQEITERVQAEEALRNSEALYHSLVENLPQSIFRKDLEGRFTFANQHYCAMQEKTLEAIIGKTDFDIHPFELAKQYQEDDRQLIEGEEIFETVEEHQPLGGEKSYVYVIKTPTYDAQGQVSGIQGIFWDVTQRKRVEEEIRRRNRELTLLNQVIEQSAESVLIFDAEMSIVYVNPAFERISGYSRAEAIGQNPDRLLESGKHGAAFYQELQATLAAGQVWRGRFVNKKKDGSLYTEDTAITPVRNERGEIINYVGIGRDITRELQLEEQYRQAQKMEAIGRLAGGMAHDFNNILTAIIGYASLSLDLDSLPPDHHIRSDLLGILKSAERAASLTRQLLTFARKQIIHPIALDLNNLTLDINKMLRRLIGEDIELVTLPAPDLGWVKAAPGQIEQVLVNLAINARDAMPEGGKLTIETANVTLDEEYASQRAEVEAGEYVMLAVSDTGIGMSEEVRARIFEPFFTTKERGQGTGLGLATCFGIVKQSGGHIWIYSEVGRGTTFKVYLPRIERKTGLLPQSTAVQPALRGTETILLVEDEPLVRKLAARTLRGQGYTILEATNGDEALRVGQGQPETEIQLLLTDVVMPQMGGKELAIRIKAIRPGIKVLYTSGYTDNAIAHHSVLDAGVSFLQKPFSPETLARKVREVLDTPENKDL